MRHIGFDDSEVMRELAKIADQKNLITKTASYELVQALARGDYGAGAMNPGLGKELALAAQSNPKDPIGAVRQLMDTKFNWLQPEQRQAVEQILAAHAPKTQAELVRALARGDYGAGAMNPGLGKELALAAQSNPKDPIGAVRQLMDTKFNWLQPEQRQAVEQILAAHAPKTQAAQPAQAKGKKSNLDLDNVKMADEKLYDVSGETGEQLVDKAHPGGGTKTELSHSKTDENLVETIVEQQKKDVEVALSMPKGTYAALLNLADRLDKLGYVKAADRVDALLKKKIVLAANPAALREYKALSQQVVNQLIDAVKRQSISDQAGAPQQERVDRSQFVNKLEYLRNSDDYFKTYREALALVNQHPAGRGAWNAGLATVSPHVNRLSVFYQAARPQQQQGPGVATTQHKVDPETGLPTTQEGWEAAGAGKEEITFDESGSATTQDKKKLRLNRLQNQLRTMVGLQAKQDKPFDRQLANVLRKNYPDAWTAVKNKAGFRAIFDAIKNQGKGTAKKEKTAPPAPPTAPGGEASPEVVEEQVVNKMFSDAMKGLGARGYPVQDLRESVMETIRKEVATGKKYWNLADQKGAQNIWKAVRKQLNTDFPPRR